MTANYRRIFIQQLGFPIISVRSQSNFIWGGGGRRAAASPPPYATALIIKNSKLLSTRKADRETKYLIKLDYLGIHIAEKPEYFKF